MGRKSIDELGELQKAIMEIVWSAQEATAQQVLDAVCRRQKKSLAYTTILSAMQKLEKLGWLKRRREGRSHVYRAAASRDDEGRRSLRKLTSRVFEGDPKLVFQQLLHDQRLTPEDLEDLARMVRRRKKELSDD